MRKTDKATLHLFRGDCCCCDCRERKAGGTLPTRPMVNGRPTPHTPIRASEDTPFIPTVTSFATGQRPSDFGTPHVPKNNLDGSPSGDGWGGYPRAFVVLDSGEVRELGDVGFHVDHQARELRLSSTITSSRIERDRASGEFLTINFKWWEVAVRSEGFQAELTTRMASSRVVGAYDTRINRRLTYAGEESYETGTAYTSNPSYAVDLWYTAADAVKQRPAQIRFRARRVWSIPTKPDEDPIPETYWWVEGYVHVVRQDVYDRWEWRSVPLGRNWSPLILLVEADDPPELAWPFAPGQLLALPVQDPKNTDPDYPVYARSQSFNTFVFAQDNVPPPDLPDPEGPRWLSPDGRIRVEGPPTTDHARLSENDRLITPAGTFSGPGSWAAFRRPDGGTAILIQTDDDWLMRRVDLPAEGEATLRTVPMQTFLVGTGIANWNGFAMSGPLHNTWPPHEALTRDQQGGAS